MVYTKKDQENSIKLTNALYDYSRWIIEKKQDLNKKVESRIFTCLAFSGVEIKLISDLFNQIPPVIVEQQKLFFIGWKLLATIPVIIAAWYLISSLLIKTENVATSASIKKVLEKREEYKRNEEIFKASIITEWEKFSIKINNLVEIKLEKLNNGIWFLFYGAAVYGIGAAIQLLFI